MEGHDSHHQQTVQITDINSLNKCISFSSPPSHRCTSVEIGRFFLKQECRSKGHGKKIAILLFGLYKKNGCTEIHVTPTRTTRALSFYSSLGFRKQQHNSSFILEFQNSS